MVETSAQDFKKNYGDVYPFDNNYFDQGNFIQHYLDVGPKDAPAIVMLHGNPTWSFYYRNLVKKYSKKFRVIVPDHMGCGFSTKPQDQEYSLENHVNHLSKLLNSLGIKKFHLIVHDWGGAIGMSLATQRPDDILSIVILNTAAFVDAHIPARISLCRLPVIGNFIVRAFNAFAWPATFMTTVKPLTGKIKKAYLYPYNNYKNRIAISNFVQDIPMEKSHKTYNYLKNVEANLKKLTCEKIIIWGAKDFCFNDHFYKRWTEIFPEAGKYYFEDSGHYILEDSKERVEILLDQFYKN